jgi:hypothetical protein
MRRKIALGLLLVGALPAFLGCSAAPASARWPVTTKVYPQLITVIGPDEVAVIDGGEAALHRKTKNNPTLAILKGGEVSYFGNAVSSQIKADPGTFVVTPDGTFYGNLHKGPETKPVDELVAVRNGHLLWQKRVTLCPASTFRLGVATNAQMGRDGVLYVIFSGGERAGSCRAKLFGFNPTNGATVGKQYLLSAGRSSPKSLMTFKHEVVVRDAGTTYLYFRYGATGATISRTTRTLPGGNVWADQDETMYSLSAPSGCKAPLAVNYITRNGSRGSYRIPLKSGCDFGSTLGVGLPHHGIAVLQGDPTDPSITEFTPSAHGVRQVTLKGTTPKGFREADGGLWSDTRGDVAYGAVRFGAARGKPSYVVVRVYDFVHRTVKVVWDSRKHVKGSDVGIYYHGSGAVSGGFLYQGLQTDKSHTPIYKIALPGFGPLFKLTGVF